MRDAQLKQREDPSDWEVYICRRAPAHGSADRTVGIADLRLPETPHELEARRINKKPQSVYKDLC